MPASAIGDLGVLLDTKIAIPRHRTGLLARPEVAQRLSRAIERELVLVSAPAGFGKTTLLAHWASRATYPVAWLSLDPDDDDPVRFLRYLIAAIRRAQEGFGEHLAALITGPNRPASEMLAVVLVNELAALPEETAIVLDDYHVIESRSVHEIVGYFAEHNPERVHLVISSRADPPLPLPRLRGRGKLGELRAADLRFAPPEIAAFFGEVWGLELPTEIVNAVGARTEGWVAGLQLAALALQGAPDAAAFADAFTGTHRFVLDFLSEEVLEHQPEDVRRFLVETSVLERISASVAEALTGRPDSAQVLELLERANLFVVPLDEHRRWYRYHQLFAEMLRARLRREGRERERELHRAAAAWCQTRGMVDEAIRHWVGGGDPEQAATLIERHVEELILRTSERATMDRWLHSLPDHVLESRPRLLLAQGIAALIEGRVEDVEPLLQMAEKAGPAEESHEPSVGRGASVLGNVPALTAIMHADVARLRGAPRLEQTFANEALARLSPGDTTLGSFARYHLAVADWMAGRLAKAEHGLTEVIAERRTSGERYLAARASYDLGQVQLARGRLRAAAATYRRAIEIVAAPGKARPAAAGIGMAGVAEVRRERGDLEGALADATEGVELCRLLAYAPPLATALVTLAWTRQALGDPEGAVEAIDEAVAVVPSEEVSVLHDPTHAERARLLLAQGRIEEVVGWFDERGLGDEDEVPYPKEREYLVAARLLVSVRAADRARRLLERLEPRVAGEGRTGNLIVTRAVLALALDASGEREAALVNLSEAISLARPSGQIAAFADEGPAMGELLQRLVLAARRDALADVHRIPPEFLARLIRACPPATPDAGVAEAPGVEHPTVVEPLSARELEVLRLLAAGRANRQIAGELFVTLDTVKKHVSHICQKLSAANRTQAVVYARELGLIR